MRLFPDAVDHKGMLPAYGPDEVSKIEYPPMREGMSEKEWLRIASPPRMSWMVWAIVALLAFAVFVVTVYSAAVLLFPDEAAAMEVRGEDTVVH